MIEVLALIVGSLTPAVIALLVFAKNRESITNKLFIGLTLGIVGWLTTTYYSLHTTSNGETLHWIRGVMFFVVVQNTFFFLLVHTFPDYRSTIFRRKRYWLALAYSALTAIAAISPLLFPHFKNHAPQPGPGMALFLPHALIFAVGGIVALILKYHRAEGLRKAQLRYFLAGTILMFTLEPISNFVIPVAFKSHALVAFSPLYPIIFSGLVAYAIVTTRLFDIRAAVARSAGYILLVGAVAGSYVLILFGVVNSVFPNPSQETLRQILSVALVFPLALGFERTKYILARLTNRFFYHDSYDVQDVIDELGRVAVSKIELYRILHDTRAVLGDALKSSFIEFILFKNGRPYFEARTHRAIADRMMALGPQMHEQHKDLLVVDELGPHHPLRDSFQQADVVLSLKLKAHEQVVGYIIFGNKKGGDIYTPQDKRLLLIAANELAIAIQNALRFEEIANFNLTLQAKVDEATRNLRKANERLKELDETKDDFISMASHQLRTPLTSVKGYISMVLEGDAGKINETQRKLLEQSFFSSQRMVFLISDLLNVSRLRTGKFVIEPTPVNLADMVEQEMDQLRETAAGKELTLTYEKPKEFPSIMLDETKTRQVIMNFVDNAIYYTPAGGHIGVELRETPASVELRVVDDGIGVPKAEQHHLFTKFYRAGNARKARPDGTGLGLFMAKKVVVAQGGAIIFESAEDKGSTFGFVFSKTKLASTDKNQESGTKNQVATVVK